MSLDEVYTAGRAHLWDEFVTYNHDRFESYVPSLMKGLEAFHAATRSKSPVRFNSTKESWETIRPFVEDEKIGTYSKSSHVKYMEFARQKLDNFRISVLDASRSHKSRDQFHSDLVNLAQGLRYLKCVRILLMDCMPLKLASRFLRLMRDSSFLGRLKSAHETFMKCAETLPNFERISIQPAETVRRPELL